MERNQDLENPIEEIITWNIIAGNKQGDQDKAETYIDLIKEEHQEWLEALEKNNAAEELDAIVDQIWVLVGRAHTKGYDLAGAIEEVANSNFSKFILDPDEINLRREIIRYAEEGVAVTTKEVFGATVLVDDKGKVRKPSSYTKADCSKFV